MNFGHIKKIHFVGVGGIGMSGLAEILSGSPDLVISGCDLRASSVTERLSHLGISVQAGHRADHVEGNDLIVISSAVKADNVEVLRARELRIPVMRRAEMLGEITRLKKGIAIAGTHGKTTTSAMTAMVLAGAGLDPTLVIGGVLRNIDTSARLGKGEYLVVEADEYDRSFLELEPTIAVVTNIEADHLDYYKDIEDIRSTFADFVARVPLYGSLIGCSDDVNVATLLDTVPRYSVRYGLHAAAELKAEGVEFSERGVSFEVRRSGELLGRASLGVPGLHNVRNALAAIAVALELEVPFVVAADALSGFTGVERRFQIRGQINGAIVVDDYAHHPTEVHATLEAARRSYPARRIVALFQPHLYSRTRDFAEGFAESLAAADLAFVAPIYAAREEPIAGVSSAMITAAALAAGAENVQPLDRDIDGIADYFRAALRPQDLFITMGAGDVHRVAEQLAEAQA
jgi:UDP-N-acetylmuramate--alanine ligase